MGARGEQGSGLIAGAGLALLASCSSPEAPQGSSHASAPSALPLDLRDARLAAGATHTCMLTPAHTVKCWGDNTFGQATPPGRTYVALAAGRIATCALGPEGGVECWGGGEHGPRPPVAPPSPFLQLSGRSYGFCALNAAGHPTCWGVVDSPLLVPPQDVALQQLVVNDRHGCGLTSRGSLLCWGREMALPAVGEGLTKVDALGERFCVLGPGGQLQCWDGSPGGVPPQAPPGGGWRDVVVGLESVCALSAEGIAVCKRPGSHEITAPSVPLSDLVAGFYHACGLDGQGEARCWGMNTAGQTIVPGEGFVQVKAGKAFACALRAEGRLECWGKRVFYPAPYHSYRWRSFELGVGQGCGVTLEGERLCWDNETEKLWPFIGLDLEGEVLLDLDTTCVRAEEGFACTGPQSGSLWYFPTEEAEKPRSIALGHAGVCALKRDGRVLCWGRSFEEHPAPDVRFAEIGVGFTYACGLTEAEGRPVCWGKAGEEGLEAPWTPDVPEEVTGARGLSCGDQCCALTSTGEPFCFASLTPLEPKLPDEPVQEIQVGHSMTCWLTLQGEVRCSGYAGTRIR